jgi:hypothetical protein
MQGAQADKLRPGADPMVLPVVPIQVFQERNTPFESFEILTHTFHTPRNVTLRILILDSQPRMVEERRKCRSQKRKGQGQTTCRRG